MLQYVEEILDGAEKTTTFPLYLEKVKQMEDCAGDGIMCKLILSIFCSYIIIGIPCLIYYISKVNIFLIPSTNKYKKEIKGGIGEMFEKNRLFKKIYLKILQACCGVVEKGKEASQFYDAYYGQVTRVIAQVNDKYQGRYNGFVKFEFEYKNKLKTSEGSYFHRKGVMKIRNYDPNDTAANRALQAALRAENNV